MDVNRLTPLKITVEFGEGTLQVTDRGVSWEGEGTPSNDELYSLVTYFFDHYRGPRAALGLEDGNSLHRRMVTNLTEGVRDGQSGTPQTNSPDG